MEQRYKHIFNVINDKHSAIQTLYKKLGSGRGNLAVSEQEKDQMIEDFTDRQIREYELKVKGEEERK